MSAQNQHDVDELIAKYQPELKSFIRKRVVNKEDAEDILQDVFYQLIKTIGTAMSPIEQVSAWLYRVARNTIINHGTKKRETGYPCDVGYGEILKEFSEILFNDSASTPDMEYLRSLVWSELEKALSELSTEQRGVFELTEMEGFTIKEISQATGIPANTLLSRKHYAVLHLRKRMRDLYNEIIYY